MDLFWSVCALVLALACVAQGFYFPGRAPTNFCTKEIKKRNPKADCQVCVCIESYIVDIYYVHRPWEVGISHEPVLVHLKVLYGNMIYNN